MSLLELPPRRRTRRPPGACSDCRPACALDGTLSRAVQHMHAFRT